MLVGVVVRLHAAVRASVATLKPTSIKSCKLINGGLYSQHRRSDPRGGRCPGRIGPSSIRHRKGICSVRTGCQRTHLETASIDAFEILATELGARGAPPALIRAARVATVDERRHAEAIGRSRRQPGERSAAGGVRHSWSSPRHRVRSRARTRSRGACVRTYAALLACRQAARAAADPAIVVRDDRHRARRDSDMPALAWAVDGWTQALLAPAACRRVREARREAIEGLVNAPLRRLAARTTARRPGCPTKTTPPAWRGSPRAALV